MRWENDYFRGQVDDENASILMGIEVSKDAGIFLSLNYPKSLNDVCKGFRALAAHIGELFV